MRYFLERTLHRIEREANDDLLQLKTLGPQHFPTADLYDLLEQLEGQKKLVRTKLQYLYRIGALIPVCIAATFVAIYFGIPWLALVFLAGVPLFGVWFTVRSLRIRREYPTYYNSQVLEYKVRQELRRRQESSIF